MTSGGEDRTLAVAADGMGIDCYQLPLSMNDGAAHNHSDLLIPAIAPSRLRR
jgi:hypothetical protein